MTELHSSVRAEDNFVIRPGLMVIDRGDDCLLTDFESVNLRIFQSGSGGADLLSTLRQGGMVSARSGAPRMELQALYDRNLVVRTTPADPSSELPADRYERQVEYLARLESLSRDRFAIQEGLRSARIVVIGAGGAANFVVQSLAAMGIGHLAVIDDDTVAMNNLNRQVLYRPADVGTAKIEAMRRWLRDFNPGITFSSFEEKIVSVARLIEICAIERPDLVIATADSPPLLLRRIVNEACFQAAVPALFFGAFRIGPLVVPDRTACWMCFERQLARSDPFYSDLAEVMAADRSPPSIVFLPGLSGTLAAHQTLHFLSRTREPQVLGRIVVIDARTLESTTIPLHKDPACPVCGSLERGDER